MNSRDEQQPEEPLLLENQNKTWTQECDFLEASLDLSQTDGRTSAVRDS